MVFLFQIGFWQTSTLKECWEVPCHSTSGDPTGKRSQAASQFWGWLQNCSSRFPRVILGRKLVASSIWANWSSDLCSRIKLQFSWTVVSDSLRPYGLQHARLPCLSPTPGACSNSCPLSRWCHPAISSAVVPFSSCLQSFIASGSFPVSQFFASRGHSIHISASVLVLPMNI